MGVISVAKISGDERIVISFPNIGEDTEIEIFGKDESIGFPSDKFSLKNLRDNNLLEKDKYGNYYYNLDICVEQYSSVDKKNGEYFIGTFKISKERVEKNINHLRQILKYRPDKEEMITNKIHYLEELIK